MARSIRFSASLLPLSAIVLTLAACQSAPAPTAAPAPVVPPIIDQSAQPALEQRVQNLENQMRDAQPTLRKVDAIESHFKALSVELDEISKNYKMNEVQVSVAGPVHADAEPAAKAPVAEVKKAEVKKEEPKPVAKAEPVATPAGFAVTSVRVGEQGKNMTRIVLDTTKPAEIHYDLDNAEGLLVIDIPGAKWSTTESHAVGKSLMVKAFKGLSDEGGSHFVAELKKKAKVVATARLNPSGTSGHRVYIDIAPAE